MSVLIKGLNIEPCDDGFGGRGLVIIGYDDKLYAVAHEQIVPLPDDATIEPKKGKWTKHAEAWSTWWTCSECGWDSIDCDYRYDDDGWYVEDVPMSYCPCCGAKMERSEE